jgi:hypothetical protein
LIRSLFRDLRIPRDGNTAGSGRYPVRSAILQVANFLQVRREFWEVLEICPIGIHLFHGSVNVGRLFEIYRSRPAPNPENLAEWFVADCSGQECRAGNCANPASGTAGPSAGQQDRPRNCYGSNTKRRSPVLLGEFGQRASGHTACKLDIPLGSAWTWSLLTASVIPGTAATRLSR